MSITDWLVLFILALLLSWNVMVFSTTAPGDLAVIEEFRKGLENPELLKWPDNGDPCGPPQWPHVFCSGSRVGQIQVQGMGLKGTLPQDLNKLSMLSNVGLQKNGFTGKLPTFKGLSKLQYVYLDYNSFDSIPSDFFDGLTRLQVISLDSNPFNQTTGWVLPENLADSAQLVNFSCSSCNLVGPVPDFLGKMASMTSLRLSGNNLTGELPMSFGGSNLQILHLNDQTGDGLNGSIAVLSSMVSLTELWLHGNSLSGVILSNISSCVSLKDLLLHNNKLTGIIPQSMGTMKQLQKLQLDHNKFIGPIPKLGIPTYTYDENSFCELKPGIPCSPEVSALLDFLGGINYPLDLVGSWSGNSPCSSTWLGISCTSNKVSVINLQNRKLTGFISPSLGKLDALMNILLGSNKLSGTIPANLTALKSLKILNLTSNNLEPPVPRFREDVVLHINDNPSLGAPSVPKPPGGGNQSATPAPPGSTSPPTSNPPPGAPPSTTPPTPSFGSVPQPPSPSVVAASKGSKAIKILAISSSVIVGALAVVAVIICLYRQRKRMVGVKSPSSTIVHPKDLSDPKNELKIPVKDSPYRSVSISDLLHSEKNDTHMVDSANQMISVHILRDVTQDFAPENELGRGGFGIVYKGQLHDGTMIAVKRMESTFISNKAFNEFDSEITVLSKLRHRNLVSLLGYSMEDNERILVYEYMPQGALSKHLFQWKRLGFDPLTWKKRLNIALDVARGMEYLHSLAHQSFIHRDLKPSNILLGDDFRAKVSDFGLVKLSPDGKNSVATTLAGTFGYLAPEYAVTGKITTKVDVYSFGVVLMELLTGLKALDEDRPDETRYLASWFCNIKSDRDNLMATIDTSITMTDDTFESISIIAELAGHCAANEAQQRPDMGHAVSVLSQLVEKWKPVKDESENYMGIDLRQPLSQMVEGWQAGMDSDISLISLDNSKGSIPARPNGFAESFTSTDGR